MQNISTLHNYQERIDELRSTERQGSNEYLYQVLLVGACILIAWYFLGEVILVVWFAVVYGLSGIERYLHRQNPQPYSRKLYILYVCLGTTIACVACAMPVYLWTFDDRIYHFAALVYTVGAVLNTFVVRSKAWPALLCYAIPNGLAMFAVAVMFFTKEGFSISSFIALVLAAVITTYLVIMVRETVRKVRVSRDTTKALLLAQKSETLANFSGGVAHDFNNLLGVILASLEQAKDEKDPKGRQYLLDQAIAAVDRGAGLTKQLLTVGRRTDLKTETINVEQFTTELKQFLSRIIPSSINLHVSHDPDLKTIESEPTLLQSMLLNLALNARAAMADHGTLDISIDRFESKFRRSVTSGFLAPGKYAAFQVEDNGRGMGEEVFGQVLEPFFSTRPVGEGTGLGLAMVAGFTEQVGGALDISTKEGVGTIVRFYLPLPKDPAPKVEAVVAETNAVEATVATNLKVLLVEDEATLNKMLSRHLTLQNYTVLSCENGDSAAKQIDAGYQPDVIITDLVMPGDLQGTDLVEYIRAVQPNVSAIMISGYSFTQEGAARALSANSQTFTLQKPFKLTELDQLLLSLKGQN